MSLLPSRAVAFLRRRTTFRAFKFYLEWLRRAVGLTTLVYLFAWFGIFLVSGLQFLTPLSKPLPFPLPIVVSVVLALSLLAPLVRSRVPPVTLNRRDLYRLGLAPVSPWLSLRWPLVQSWLLRAAIAIVLGLAWWVLAHTWLVRETPWAAIGLALIAVTHLNLGWLRYARGASRSTPFLGAASVALALVGIVIPDVGLGASLYSWGAGSLIVPAVFALVSSRVVYATLTQKYPPKFAAQCFVLSELQIVRTLNTLAAFSGTKGVSRVERTRLLEKLHDRAGRTPRQLPPPPSTAPAWRVLAWRTNLACYIGLLYLVGRSVGVTWAQTPWQAHLLGFTTLTLPVTGYFAFLEARAGGHIRQAGVEAARDRSPGRPLVPQPEFSSQRRQVFPLGTFAHRALPG